MYSREIKFEFLHYFKINIYFLNFKSTNLHTSEAFTIGVCFEIFV